MKGFIIFAISIIGFCSAIAFIKFKLRKTLEPHIRTYIRDKYRKLRQEKKDDPEKLIIELDKLLDYTLKNMGYGGNTSAKIKKAHKKFSAPKNVINAHRTRNKIVHEVEVDVNERMLEKAISSYEQAYIDLKITK